MKISMLYVANSTSVQKNSMIKQRYVVWCIQLKAASRAHIRDKHGKALAKSQYERKADQDIIWETEDDYNARMAAVKELTTGFTVTDV